MGMKPVTLKTIADVTGGKLVGGGEDTLITGVVRDNREVKDGFLFVCFPGARVDGHDFASDAFSKGAAACLAQRELSDAAGPYILVEDTFTALKELAKYYRSLLNIPIIGVTGSVGKTTAKEMTAAALSAKLNVLKTAANLNNEIGVPLTLLSITEEHDAAVVEMGISDFGEMARLADMVRPDICIMTTIGFCHLETLGDLDGVLRAKSEVFEYMGENGVAIVNGDDEKLGAFDPGVRKITFGYGENNDWRGVNVRTDGTEGVLCDITNPDGAFSAYIPAFGSHMVLGALPAAIAARLLGLTDEEIERGLLKYAPVGGRANIQETGYIRIINDCYNANPNSMAASLASLSEVEGRKVAILGDMKELGAASRDLHRSIGDLAGQYKIDSLICLGAEAEFIYKGFIAGGYETEAWHFPMKEAMFSVLPRLIKEGDTVLVKASHSMGFDEVVEELKKLK